MRKILLSTVLLAAGLTSVQAGTVTEDALIANVNYDRAGTFGAYDFEPIGDESPFDWAFTMDANGKTYQMRGKESTDSDLFGWKEVDIEAPAPEWHMFQVDVDGDGTLGRFDWVLLSDNINKKASFKLEGVAESGSFDYSDPLNIDYKINGKAIQIGPAGSFATESAGAVTRTFNGTLLGADAATVCVDENRNKSCDAGETSTTTTDGTFALEMTEAQDKFHLVAQMADGSCMEGDVSLGGEISALTTIATYKNDLRPAEQVKEIYEALLNGYQVTDDNKEAKNALFYAELKKEYEVNGVADLSGSERVGTMIYTREFVFNNGSIRVKCG